MAEGRAERSDERSTERSVDAPAEGGLLRSGLIVSALTLLSRISGFARDQIVAVNFGASPVMDAFFVAFKIPNLLRRLFGEGAFAKGFVPIFTEYRETRSHAELQQLLAYVLGTLGGVLLLLSAVAVAAAPLLVLLFAPGFADEPERLEAATTMLRITFPYLFFISLVAAAGGVFQSIGRFVVPAFTPVFLNLVLIASALWLSPHLEQPVYALAWGVLVAGVVQLLFQLPFLARVRLLPRPRWGWRDSGVQRVFKLMVPAIVGAGVYQINQLVNTILASLLVAGSVSWLYYADRLLEFPMGMIGIAVGIVVLPRLSALHTRGSSADFSRTIGWSIKVVLWAGLPAAMALGWLAKPMLITLFEYGRFTSFDRDMAAMSLQVLALSLPAGLLINVLTPSFYARQDSRTPVRIGVMAMAVNMVIGSLVVFFMMRESFVGAHAGLSAAVVLSSWVQVSLLIYHLKKQAVQLPLGLWWYTLRPLLLAMPAMAAVIWALNPAVQWWAAADALARCLQLFAIMGAAGLAYVVALLIAGVRPADIKA